MNTALTIAGSDSCGGAGIQADIKTMTAHGVYAMSAITALTAQNTTGVTDILNSTPEFLAAQLDAVFTDIFPDAVKIGMVSETGLIDVIAEKLTFYKAKNIVLDPVMVATSGSKLISDDAIDSLCKKLIPLALLITPNIPEAEVLSGCSIHSPEDMETAARVIYEKYGTAVLLKGGHDLNDANDLLYDGKEVKWFYGTRVDNPNTHGTGCTLSSAIASNLAKGRSLSDSVAAAKRYITGALSAMLDLGKGRGPMNHAFAIRGLYERKLTEDLKDAAADLWAEAEAQPFVEEMALGTLSPERFKYYMLQDYYYLREYIKILAVIRSHADTDEVKAFVDGTTQVVEEELKAVHLPNMEALGITEKQMEKTGLSEAGAAYLSYLHQTADAPAIYGLTALLQCSWLYAHIAENRMKKNAETIKTSDYRSWFEAYTSEGYTAGNETWMCLADRLAENIGLDEREKLCQIFRTCAGHENRFWKAAYNGTL